MPKINVIQFVPYFPPHIGGLELIAAEFAKTYTAVGHGKVMSVTFSVGQIATTISYSTNDYLVYVIPSFEIIHGFPFPKFRTKQFRQVLSLVHSFIKNNPNTVIQTHTRFFLSTLLGAVCAKIWGKKWVHVEHGIGYIEGLSFRVKCIADVYDHTIGRMICNMCDHIIAISNASKVFVQKRTKNKITAIYNGTTFNPAKRKIKQQGEPVRLGFIGRLVKLKGVDILLEAYAKLIKEESRVLSLSIVGDGDHKNSLQQQVNKLGIADYVDFLGYHQASQVPGFLAGIDILINPSLQEGLGMVVVEGLLAGCIVVATDVGGVQEINGGKNLIRTRSKSVDALHDAIYDALVHKLKNIGYVDPQLNQQFSSQGFVDKYFAVYKEVLQD